jgi:ADP-ribose pyrophosphatase YjhB (NUDIX family)
MGLMKLMKYARYGPVDRYEEPPNGGMCITAVAVIRRNRKVLLGHATTHPRWREEWLTTLQSYTPQELKEAYAELRLPGAYLQEGEHPYHALARVMRDQLEVKKYESSPPLVLSWYSLSDWYPGERHWDLLFAYKVRAQPPSKIPPWWRDLGWNDCAGLQARDFGWNRELMQQLKLVSC